MSSLDKVSVMADTIVGHQTQIKNYSSDVNDFFNQITELYVENKGIKTKQIEQLYKDIETAFGKKSKLEQEVVALKRSIFKELGVE